MSRPRFARLVPDNLAVTTIRRRPHPVALYMQQAIDTQAGLGMAGYRGHRRIGEPSSRFVVFKGDLGALQFFQGAASLIPRGTANRAGFNRALPGTSGPPAHPNTVLDLIGTNADIRTAV